MILVKHSLSQVDPVIPSRQWLLSAEGVRRCLPLAGRLADYHPDIIISSDEPKAIETGRIVAEQLALPWQIGQDLHEQERESATFYPSVTDFEKAVKLFSSHPINWFSVKKQRMKRMVASRTLSPVCNHSIPTKGWLSSPRHRTFTFRVPPVCFWPLILSGNA